MNLNLIISKSINLNLKKLKKTIGSNSAPASFFKCYLRTLLHTVGPYTFYDIITQLRRY